jgi:hypothetical protein
VIHIDVENLKNQIIVHALARFDSIATQINLLGTTRNLHVVPFGRVYHFNHGAPQFGFVAFNGPYSLAAQSLHPHLDFIINIHNADHRLKGETTKRIRNGRIGVNVKTWLGGRREEDRIIPPNNAGGTNSLGQLFESGESVGKLSAVARAKMAAAAKARWAKASGRGALQADGVVLN